MRDIYILGIESSCDETAAAVVRSGEQVMSNAVFSQIATHQPYGGVVPELASREHLRAIVPIVRQALADAGQTYESIDALAVTKGPGLPGSLLVGVSYAKALAFALDKPLVAVNHLEGHIHAVLLEERQKGNHQLQFPLMTLVVSGGHTHLYLAQQNEGGWSYRNVGHTRDDAAGEAFDKVAKLLALGYPGGPIIDAAARHGDPTAVKFPPAQIKHPPRGPQPARFSRIRVEPRGARSPYPTPPKPGAVGAPPYPTPPKPGVAGAPPPEPERPHFDFSYSGIKTAVLRYVETHGMQASIDRRRAAWSELVKPKADAVLALCDRQTLDLVASFQRAMVDDLITKTLAAAYEYDVAMLLVSGGVAANSELRQDFERRAAQAGLSVHFPSRLLSTDNAAMIAAAAYPKFLAGELAPPELSAEASLPLK